MSSLLTNTAICTTLLASVVDIIAAKNASEIPRFNTPYTGNLTDTTWPLPMGTFGCGFPGNPPGEYLQECTEPINPNAPANMVGFWRNNETGLIRQRVEMCGDRTTFTNPMTVHDFPACTGISGDGSDLRDYNTYIIERNSTLCSSIAGSYCKFEAGENGEKCMNIYKDLSEEIANLTGFEPGENLLAWRCVAEDGETMKFFNFQTGLSRGVIYERVAPEDEPNCMMCVGGEHDGAVSFGPDDVLPCPMLEREWTKCDTESGSTRIIGTSVMIFGGSLLMFLALL